MLAIAKASPALLAALFLASCKIPRDAAFDPAGDPLAPAAALAANDLPFLEVTGSAAPSKTLLSPEDKPYTLRAGDVLEIEVVDVPATHARTVVLPDGMLYFDAAQGVRAGGRTVAEVEDALAEQLAATYSFPVVSANLYDVQGNRYTVLGQVKVPGSYPLRQPTTLIDAIASAGGLNATNATGRARDLADLGRSALIRDGKLMPVNFRKLVEEGDMRHNVYMKPGDYVFLPAVGGAKVYVLGSVNRPAAVAHSSRLTLVSALAEARGVQKEAYAAGLVLIRGSFQEPKLARVDLRAILRGGARDFALQPGDIIWVPKKPWSKLGEYAELALSSVATSVALNEAYKAFGEEIEDDSILDTGANQVEVQPNPQDDTPVEQVDLAPASQPDPAPAVEEPAVIEPAPVG